jgi:hypothetical protein
MFKGKYIAAGIVILSSIYSYGVQKQPRIEYNKGGPDYASVLNKVALQGKDAQDNAASLYLKAFELYRSQPQQMYRLQVWQGWPTEMKDEQRTAIDEWLKANEAAMANLKEAGKMAFFWLTYPKDIPIGTGPLSKYTQVNSLANALCWQAKVKAADGVVGDAFEDVLAAYRFGRHIAASPHTIAEQTTGLSIQTTALWTATQIIAHANPDVAALAEFQKALQIAADSQNFYFDLTAAKLWVSDTIERTFTADGSVSKLQLEAMQQSLSLSPEDLDLWQNLNEAETASMSRRLFAFLDTEIKKMPWQLKKEGTNLTAQIDQLTNDNVLLKYYRPDIGKNIDLPFRCKAQVEAVITICAVKRYAADNRVMPPTLKVLAVSGYIKDEPLDPYRNGPLSYVDVPNNFRLYSWGADFRDNFARPSKWGEGPAGGDEVFWPIP